MSCSGQVLPGSVEKMADFQCTVFHHRLWWKTFFLFVCLSWFDVSFFSFFFLLREDFKWISASLFGKLCQWCSFRLWGKKRELKTVLISQIYDFLKRIYVFLSGTQPSWETRLFFCFFFVNRSEIIFICFAEWQLSLHCLIFNITG